MAAATSEIGSIDGAGTVAETSVASRGPRIQQPGQSLAQARRHVPGGGGGAARTRREHGRHGAGSGKSQPSCGSGTSPMRSAGTPALRSRAARRAG